MRRNISKTLIVQNAVLRDTMSCWLAIFLFLKYWQCHKKVFVVMCHVIRCHVLCIV